MIQELEIEIEGFRLSMIEVGGQRLYGFPDVDQDSKVEYISLDALEGAYRTRQSRLSCGSREKYVIVDFFYADANLQLSIEGTLQRFLLILERYKAYDNAVNLIRELNLYDLL